MEQKNEAKQNVKQEAKADEKVVKAPKRRIIRILSEARHAGEISERA